MFSYCSIEEQQIVQTFSLIEEMETSLVKDGRILETKYLLSQSISLIEALTACIEKDFAKFPIQAADNLVQRISPLFELAEKVNR